jgi:hypothetical protein
MLGLAIAASATLISGYSANSGILHIGTGIPFEFVLRVAMRFLSCCLFVYMLIAYYYVKGKEEAKPHRLTRVTIMILMQLGCFLCISSGN